FTIRPFNDHDLTDDPVESARRTKFNRKLSSLRIFVEHAFGRLKGRFPILRNMPGRNLKEVYRTIEALMIIHNILEAFGDDPSMLKHYNGAEDADVDAVRGEADARVVLEMDGDDMYRAGLLRRKQLLDLIVPP
ncbi:hypothetical protein FA95DRAFT_1504574, partial [Auriscalpium vulgare]